MLPAAVLLLLVLSLQESPVPKPEPDGGPPLEYAFNPHQAKKEMEVGEFYMRKRSYSAAVSRFEQALKWHPRLSAAYLRLGVATEKSGELQRALEAYRKYLEIEPRGSKARDARHAIARLEKELKE